MFFKTILIVLKHIYSKSCPWKKIKNIARPGYLTSLLSCPGSSISSNPVYGERFEVPPIRVSLRHWCKVWGAPLEYWLLVTCGTTHCYTRHTAKQLKACHLQSLKNSWHSKRTNGLQLNGHSKRGQGSYPLFRGSEQRTNQKYLSSYIPPKEKNLSTKDKILGPKSVHYLEVPLAYWANLHVSGTMTTVSQSREGVGAWGWVEVWASCYGILTRVGRGAGTLGKVIMLKVIVPEKRIVLSLVF